MTLVAGVVVLALLLGLAAFAGGAADEDDATPSSAQTKKAAPTSQGPATRLDIPAAYDPKRGWEISGLARENTLAQGAGRLAYVERVDERRFRLRTVDTRTGERLWSSAPWKPLGDPSRVFPKLFALTKDRRQYFVTWSYGKSDGGDNDPLSETSKILSLDMYDAADGSLRRVELPWPSTPSVTGSGPAVLIGQGTTRAALVDPRSGDTTPVERSDLKDPKGCENCRELTEIRGLTSKGLLVSGAGEFWVPGAWHGRKVAPKGTKPGSGTPTSVTADHVLAKWSKKPGSKEKEEKREAAKLDVWALHDAVNGKALITTECHRPAIRPGRYPELTLSPTGRYLVAGNLAFDLWEKSGHCFEENDGAKPLTLATVTDEGVAYGATGARSAADALTGGGTPVEVRLATGEPRALAPGLRLPSHDQGGVGVFRWTDSKDVLHLIGYERRG
ncbi:hypothetical protein [Streptomyces apocyni]|uniref:hypothetical protein n=1 Tax=Streptomyces apocyni TaxID=2654677 RepID=UPI0012EADE82|nr:hypothetical protein [Streptomyces apocyni]